MSLPVIRHVREHDVADLERELTDVALGGAGWGGLLSRVAEAAGRTCRLVDPFGGVLASTDGGPGLTAAEAGRVASEPWSAVSAEDGWRARAVPAVAGGRVAAVVLIGEPAGSRQLAIAAAARTAVLIESVRRTSAGASRFEDGSTLIAALRRGAGIDASVSVAATRFGLDLSVPHCGAVLRHTGPRHRAWATALAWLERPVEQHGALAFTVVSDPAELTGVRTRVEAAMGENVVLAACGSRVGEPERYRESFDEAGRLLQELTRRGETQLAFADAGLLQVLLAVPDERLRYFVQRHLGPVLERPELLVTLQAWLDTSGSRQAVSEELHLHRNSIGYRVGQLKALLGVDPLDPQQGAVLHAALVARELLHHGSPLLERTLTTVDGHQ